MSSLRWAKSCLPLVNIPVLTATPWVLDLPSPWPTHPVPRPRTVSALSHNIGGVRSKQQDLADLLQALTPQVVAVQETWLREVAIRQFPHGYTHIRGSIEGPRTGHLVALRWDVTDPVSPHTVRHDCRE